MQFEKDHMVEMRSQTNLLEEQTGIMRSILKIKEEKWQYKKKNIFLIVWIII